MRNHLCVAACALLTLSLGLAESSDVERCLSALGLGYVVLRSRRAELLALGLLLGAMGTLRIEARREAALEAAGREARVSIQTRNETRGSARMAWLRLEDGPLLDAWVHDDEDEALPAGSRLTARVRLWVPPRLRNPDDRDRHRSELAAGALLHASVLHAEKELHSTLLARVRSSCADWMNRRLRGSAALWRALILADRSALERVTRRRLQSLGLAHLLALSGLHVGVVVGAALLLLRRRRVPMAVLVLLFAWLTVAGPTPSLLRAVAMVSWIAWGQRLERAVNPIDALAFAALVDLTLWPWRALGVGWWLSYGATLSLLRARSWLSRRPPVLGLLGASTCAQLGGLPWVLSAFGKWVWFGPLSNLLLATAFSVLLVGGIALLLSVVALPFVDEACLSLLKAATHAFGWMLGRAAILAPDALGHPGLSRAWWGVALSGWFALFVADGPLRWRFAILIACWAAPHASLLFPHEPSWQSLDVGQGDAGVYRTNDAWMVVDAGPAFDGWSAAESIVLPYLARRNASGVTLLLTHGHLDHYGDSRALLSSGRVSRLIVARSDSGRTWSQRLDHPGVERLYVARGDSFALGAEQIPVLWPPATAGEWETNDRSVVVAVGPSRSRLLLTGDLEEHAERQVAGDVAAAVLKLGHHGANTSTHDPFLARVSPRWAIASCGMRNRYGHPHPVLMHRLQSRGIEVFRTDRQGAIELRWKGEVPKLRAIAGQTAASLDQD